MSRNEAEMAAGMLYRETQDGAGFANIVLNNSALCCCLGTGVKKETVAKSFLGTKMDINKSLPAMPPVLVGKLDEATWKALLRDMSNTGGFYPSTGCIICSTLTCTSCCIVPCVMSVLDGDHEASVKEFIAKWEASPVLKDAGVSVKRERFDYVDGGNTKASFIYIQFQVASGSGMPKTDTPEVQTMAPA